MNKQLQLIFKQLHGHIQIVSYCVRIIVIVKLRQYCLIRQQKLRGKEISLALCLVIGQKQSAVTNTALGKLPVKNIMPKLMGADDTGSHLIESIIYYNVWG